MEKTFRYPFWNPVGDNEIYDCILEILKEKGLSSHTSTIYTIVKDLILNGVKANLKRLFFQEIHSDITHPSDYELGVRMYKSKVLQGKLPDYQVINATFGFTAAGELNPNVDILFVMPSASGDEDQSAVKIINASEVSLDQIWGTQSGQLDRTTLVDEFMSKVNLYIMYLLKCIIFFE